MSARGRGRTRVAAACLAATLLALAVIAGPAAADGVFRLTGVIVDSSGNPIAGATVKLTAGSNVATTTTDASGAYSFPVTPGSYRMVASPGEGGYEVDAVIDPLNVTGNTQENITLPAPGTLTLAVTDANGTAASNVAITATGTSHTTGQTQDGTGITFYAYPGPTSNGPCITDGNGLCTVHYISGIAVDFSVVPPSGFSTTTSGTATPPGNTVAVQLTTYIAPPVATNLSPPTITGVAAQDHALVESHGTWSSNPTGWLYQWEDCDNSGSACVAIPGATGPSYTLAAADVGHTVRVAETAVTEGGKSIPALSSPSAVVVLPEPPVNDVLPSVSGVVNVGQVLTESHGSWSNSPTEWQYQWEDCDASGSACVAIPGATGQSYTLASGDVGQTVRAVETAGNDSGWGSPASSAATPVIAVPAVPTNTGQPPAIIGTPTTGVTLVETHAGWSNNPLTWNVQWEDCDSAGGSCVAIPGATAQSYTLTGNDLGHSIRVQEKADNAGGVSAPSVSDATGVVVASVPVNSEPPTIAGPAVVGQTLTESHGSWAGHPSRFTYEWDDCDAYGGSCAPVAGATGQTYVLGPRDVGHTLKVLETAWNTDGPSAPQSSAVTNQVLPLAPLAGSAPTISGQAVVGKTLSEGHGVWASAVGYLYQWEDCDSGGGACVGIPGATGQTYTPVASDAGHTIEVQETSYNLGGTSAPVSSAPTDLVRAAPVVDVPARQVVAGQGVSLAGTVNPEGLVTKAWFEYGLDPAYGGDSSVQYAPMPSAPVGSDFAFHPVTATLPGLVPNALYHVRLVAANGADTTVGPDQTFRTRATVAAPPVIGQSVDLTQVDGVVMFRPPVGLTAADRTVWSVDQGQGFVPLTETRHVPTGSQIDTRAGRLSLVAAAIGHRWQAATVSGALFTVSQAQGGPLKGLPTVALLEGAFAGGPSYAGCRGARSHLTIQTIHISSRQGPFGSRGRYGTVIGKNATWSVSDRCDATVITVQRGAVAIARPDGRTIRLTRGHTYVAKR